MKRVRLFSLSTCPVCKKVKQLLDDNKVPYELIEVDTLDSGEQWVMTKELKKYNPDASFPTLIIEDVIKGYDPELIKSKIFSK